MITAAGLANARADVTYVYTGNDFTNASLSFTTSDAITVSVTFASTLADNLVISGLFTSNVSPLSFSASNGVYTITNLSVDPGPVFAFDTNNSGGITGWVFDVTSGNTAVSVITRTFGNNGPLDGTGAYGDFDAFNHNPGSWSVAAAAPEPSTWAMLLLGFAGIGFAGYRHRSAAKLA